MKYIFACGGTAGHINPALAVADKMREMHPDAKILFIGAGRTLENKLVPAAGYQIKNIKINGFSRSLSLSGLKNNLMLFSNLKTAIREAKKIMEEFCPDVVFGTGGYVCYPVIKAAVALKIPAVLHESNAVPGMTAKILSGKVDNMLVAFPDTLNYYKKPERVIFTGTPVRGDFGKMKKAAAKRRTGADERPLVVSFWGSLGAARMNEMTADFIKRNCATGEFWHIHATGGGDAGLNNMLDMLRERGITEIPTHVDIRPYIEDMGKVMNGADLVLCRAGASTTAELTAVGCPSVIVPSPNVTGNHQEKNARALEKMGATKVMLESECSGDTLYETVKGLLKDSTRMRRMARDAMAAGKSDAAEKVAEVLVSLIN